MHSIQTKTTILNVVAITIAIATATVISAFSIAEQGHESSEKLLALSCETGKNNLNYYFESSKQSIDIISTLIENDLKTTDDADFVNHIDRSYNLFSEAVNHTADNDPKNRVLTFYYRIDPVISDNYADKKAEGYFYERYTNPDADAYSSFPVTDLHERTDGTDWFFEFKPSATEDYFKEAAWLPPYFTANLGAYVVSYNAPIYKNETFYGVIGIEIGYATLGAQVKDILVHKTGRAYIVDDENGVLIYHPSTDLIESSINERPAIPEALVKSLQAGKNDPENAKHHVEYTYGGVKKHAYWMALSNGMSIVVAVPLSEVNSTWINVVLEIIVAALIIITIFVVVTILYSRHFTKPLRELTEVAEEINEGHYEAKLDYHGDDEIGLLSTTVNKLVDHLGGYINDLNSLAYSDALTSVRNKSSYDIFIRELQNRIDSKNDNPEFAIAWFDCDDLKDINDNFGHDKGDVYLKNSCHLICRVFQRSPVFRVGGDEFAAILQGEDYIRRESLKRQFIEKSAEICAFAKEPWEQIRVAVGIAVYNSEIDKNVEDVMIRADHLMYENKHMRKSNDENK